MRARREVRGSAPLFWQRIDDARSTCVDSLSSATLKNGGKQLGSELRWGRSGAQGVTTRGLRWRALRESGAGGGMRARRATVVRGREVLRDGCVEVARAQVQSRRKAALRKEEGRAPCGFGFVGVPLNTHFHLGGGHHAVSVRGDVV